MHWCCEGASPTEAPTDIFLQFHEKFSKNIMLTPTSIKILLDCLHLFVWIQFFSGSKSTLVQSRKEN